MQSRIALCLTVALACTCSATAIAGAHREVDPTLEGLKITATRDGTFTLSGLANSEAAAQRAIEIDGVKQVHSRLTVAQRTHR